MEDVVDLSEEDPGAAGVQVWTSPAAASTVRAALSSAGHAASAELLLYVPNQLVDGLEEEARAAVEDALNGLRALDDVEDVWTNLPR